MSSTSQSQTSSLGPPTLRKSSRIAAKTEALIQNMKNSVAEIIFPALKNYKLSNDFLKELFRAASKEDCIFISRNLNINTQWINDFRNEMKEKIGESFEEGEEVDSIWLVVITSKPKMLMYYILLRNGVMTHSCTVYKEDYELFEVMDESLLLTLIIERKDAMNKKDDQQPSTSAALRKGNEGRAAKRTGDDREERTEVASQQCNVPNFECNPIIQESYLSITNCDLGDNEKTSKLHLEATMPSEVEFPDNDNIDLEMASGLPTDSVNMYLEKIHLDEFREFVDNELSINDVLGLEPVTADASTMCNFDIVPIKNKNTVKSSTVEKDVSLHNNKLNEECLPVPPDFTVNEIEITEGCVVILQAPQQLQEVIASDVKFRLNHAMDTSQTVTGSEEDSSENEEEVHPLNLVLHERNDVCFWNLGLLGQRHEGLTTQTYMCDTMSEPSTET